jgi:methylated-DNA-[protein]-cysteine S-methyltransferase
VTLYAKAISSPVGTLTLVASDKGLVAILWENERDGRVRLGLMVEASWHPVLRQAERELDAYFAGTRTGFSVPLDMRGTEFQKRVWHALLTIPFGETRSYGEIARQIERPNAFRAVGAANGRNPLSIVAPCHRVVGAAGALTGFGGGLAAKDTLLRHERGVRDRAAD